MATVKNSIPLLVPFRAWNEDRKGLGIRPVERSLGTFLCMHMDIQHTPLCVHPVALKYSYHPQPQLCPRWPSTGQSCHLSSCASSTTPLGPSSSLSHCGSHCSSSFPSSDLCPTPKCSPVLGQSRTHCLREQMRTKKTTTTTDSSFLPMNFR